MKSEEARIFLNYARKDMGEVRKLYELLKGYGFSPWMDIVDLKTGQDWIEAVLETIEEAPIFVICLSNHSITKTGVVRREINEALEVAKERILSGEDVYIFPVRLEEIEAEKIPRKLRKYNWVDWYSEDGKKKLIQDLKDALKRLGFGNPLNLRSKPIERFTWAEAAQMIRERNFYDKAIWPDGQGLNHEYELKKITVVVDPPTGLILVVSANRFQFMNKSVVIDHTTGLMWQQDGNEEGIDYEAAKAYIKGLNGKKLAGFSDWRLPTLEEAMSLMESTKKNGNLYIDPVFNPMQHWVWTADLSSASRPWDVGFSRGSCVHYGMILGTNYVRAVRSL